MDLILIFGLIVLASSKVTLQGMFAKKHILTLTDSICFNGIIFLFSALIFIYALKCSFPVIIFGFIFGLFTVLFQLFYIQAMSCGNVSLAVLIVNLNMIAPIIISITFFNEKIGIIRALGLVTVIVSLVLNVEKSGEKMRRKWLVCSLLAFVCNSCLAVCQQIFGKTEWKAERVSFVAWSYIIATLISVVFYFIFRTEKEKQKFKISPLAIGYGLCIGVILGVFQFLNTFAISTIEASFMYPIYNGGTLIFTTLTGVILLKDRLSLKQIITLIIGIVGIVLVNL
ncbi:MAG: EamA family transporter [Clostridia bacterium]|nr:EamA family transporter [Clostridia bacterium]